MDSTIGGAIIGAGATLLAVIPLHYLSVKRDRQKLAEERADRASEKEEANREREVQACRGLST